MSTLGEAYYAEKMAENQRAAARAAKVKAFIADSDPEIIADLFQIIKDAVVAREAETMIELTRRYLSVRSALSDLESELCR